MNTASWLEGIRASDPWRTLIAKRGPGWVAGILAIAIAAQLALLVTGLAGGGPPPAPPSVWHPHVRTTDTAEIVSSHLFGRAPQAAGTLGQDAPQTSLPLVLTGVIAGDEPSAGLAILGPNAQAAKVYAVGDSVPGGAELAAVLPRKVLLRRNGLLRSLSLPRQLSVNAPLPSAALPPSALAAPQFAARMRALVARRPTVLAALLRPEPVFVGGQLRGYRVYPGSDPRAFRELGLQPGDLVMAINGTPLNDPAQDQQVFDTLGSSSQATVTVLRNGVQRVLTLNLAQVEQAAQSLTAAPSGPTPAAPPSALPFGTARPAGPPP
jgi:general secretion pathway protein C